MTRKDGYDKVLELLEQLQDIEDNNVLIMVTYFHVKFESIPPICGRKRQNRTACCELLIITLLSLFMKKIKSIL